MIDRTVSLMIFFIHQQSISPKIIPRRGPPIETLTKFVITSSADVDSPLTRLIKSMKKTMAVPSFNKDSPSTSMLK